MNTTMKDVAKKAGVSISTVSHVINESRFVSEELIDKVQKAIEELGYQPNPWGRSLRKQQSDTIALVLPDQSNPFFHQLARGVEEQARNRSYSLLYCNTNEEAKLEDFYLSLFEQKRADGFVVAPTENDRENLERLVDRNVPLVLIDRRIRDLPVSQVCSDNESGAYQAVQHLLDLGHQKIGLSLGLAGLSTTQERFAGYKKALRRRGMEVDESLVASGFSEIEEGHTAAKHLILKRHVSALFCTNNMMTIGALKCITEEGIRCPDDVSVLGYDDSEWSTLVTPSLTVVAQQAYEMGYQAAALLFESIDKEAGKIEPKHISLDTELIIRQSTASLNAS